MEVSDFYPIDDLWGIKKEERLFKGSKNSVGKNFGSWHDVCLIEVGLWLQPGRKNFEILGGENSETPTGLLFLKGERLRELSAMVSGCLFPIR